MPFTLFARSSPGDALFVGLLTVLFVGALVHFVLKIRTDLRACGEKLGLQNIRVDSETLIGDIRGMVLRAHFIPGGKNAPEHMAIEVTFSPCALLLDLRPQTTEEERSVAAGEAIDLQTGDAAFDREWIVEGAPPARVLRLLADEALRARLREYAMFPEARVTIDQGRVVLYRRGSDRERGLVDDARIQLALALAEAVAAESETPAPDAAVEVDEAGSTYRSTARRSAEDSATDKLREIRSKRGERRLRAARKVILLAHALVPVLAVLIATLGKKQASPGVEIGTALEHVTVTLGSWTYLRMLRKVSPGLSFDTLTRAFIAGSWAVLAAAIVLLRLR